MRALWPRVDASNVCGDDVAKSSVGHVTALLGRRKPSRDCQLRWRLNCHQSQTDRHAVSTAGGRLKQSEVGGAEAWAAMARTRAPGYNGGLGQVPIGSPGGRSPGVGRRAKSAEADGILVLEHTFSSCPGACSGSRSDQTEAYI